MSCFLVVFAVGASGVLASAGTPRSGDVPCANFGRVGPALYRGAEPDPRCLEYIAQLGVRTIVSLRDEEDDSERERAGALALGMRYMNLPLSGIARPPEEVLRRILEVIGAGENQPVFVHCKRGRDRTGVVVAAHRVLRDGWTAEEAMEEARTFGLAWYQFPMKRLIRSGFDFSAAPDAGLERLEAFLEAYEDTAPGDRPALVQSFVERQRAGGGFPITAADGTVVFFYAGTGGEREVRVVGEFRTRAPDDLRWDDAGEALEPAKAGSPVYLKRLRFEPDARLDYAFRVDGEHRLDPLNPRVIRNGFVGEACELALPGYSRPEPPAAGGIGAQGTVSVVRESWAVPRVAVYLPPGYDPSRRYPVLYTADGAAWRDIIGLPGILDTLIGGGRVRPLIAVMIDAADDRSAWYRSNPAYLTYLERVVRYVDGRYPTLARPEERMHAGTSAGGRASLYAGIERPDLFLNLGLLSPSLGGTPSLHASSGDGAACAAAGTGLPRGARVWLSAGTYEGAIYRDARALAQCLERAGTDSEARWTHAGHSLGAWGNLVPEMLEFLAGPPQDGAAGSGAR